MDDSQDESDTAASAALGRRRFLVRAAVAGTAVWAVPTILTMEPAGADELTSPPPTPPEVEVEVQRETAIDPAPAAAEPEVEPEVEVRGALAVTGAPITSLLGAGASLIAGGGALHQWSARSARRPGPQPDPAAQPDGPTQHGE